MSYNFGPGASWVWRPTCASMKPNTVTDDWAQAPAEQARAAAAATTHAFIWIVSGLMELIDGRPYVDRRRSPCKAMCYGGDIILNQSKTINRAKLPSSGTTQATVASMHSESAMHASCAVTAVCLRADRAHRWEGCEAGPHDAAERHVGRRAGRGCGRAQAADSRRGLCPG